MGENHNLRHSSIEQLGRVLDDQRNLGQGCLMPHDGKVIPIDRLMIDSQKTGFESLPAEPPPWCAGSSRWNGGDGKAREDWMPRPNPIRTHCGTLRNNAERIETTGPPAIHVVKASLGPDKSQSVGWKWESRIEQSGDGL